jgi:hypothetical protein
MLIGGFFMQIDLSLIEHLNIDNYIVIIDHGYKKGKAYPNALLAFNDLQKNKGSHVENIEIFFVFIKGVTPRHLAPCAQSFSDIFNEVFPKYKNNEIQFLALLMQNEIKSEVGIDYSYQF